jgi:hypothetical protein
VWWHEDNFHAAVFPQQIAIRRDGKEFDMKFYKMRGARFQLCDKRPLTLLASSDPRKAAEARFNGISIVFEDGCYRVGRGDLFSGRLSENTVGKVVDCWRIL